MKAIKETYPNGKFEEVKAAWVTELDGFYKLTGAGLSGTTYIAFVDSTKYYKTQYQDSLNKIKVDGISDEEKAKLQTDAEYWKVLDDSTKDEKLETNWIRWIPDAPLPFERITARYGTPDKCDYNEENFLPYCSWNAKGVLVNLNENKKLAYSIEYTFTDDERKSALGIKPPEKELPKPESPKNKKKRKI